MSEPSPFAAVAGRATTLLTTYRSDGTAVSTPVSLYVDGERAYFASPADSGKVKRLRRETRVRLGTGDRSVAGQARAVEAGELAELRRRLLRPTRMLFWSHLKFRLQGKRMVFFEVVPDPVRDQ